MFKPLRELRKAMVREVIAAYAADIAGTRDDLDDALETAALEVWQQKPALGLELDFD